LLAKDTNIYLNKAKYKNQETIEKIIQFYEDFGLHILGLKLHTIPTVQESLSEKEIEELVRIREIARKNRDWENADQIRVKLLDMGIVIEDTKEGARWKKS
jgi:cysteinyl-tRNA synthetase